MEVAAEEEEEGVRISPRTGFFAPLAVPPSPPPTSTPLLLSSPRMRPRPELEVRNIKEAAGRARRAALAAAARVEGAPARAEGPGREGLRVKRVPSSCRG